MIGALARRDGVRAQPARHSSLRPGARNRGKIDRTDAVMIDT